MSWVQRVGVLVAPWAFVLVFAVVWFGVLLPRAMEGHAVLACIAVLATVALVSFALAAVTFSRDVLSGRWP